MEGIRAKTFPGNILAAMCEFNFSMGGGRVESMTFGTREILRVVPYWKS